MNGNKEPFKNKIRSKIGKKSKIEKIAVKIEETVKIKVKFPDVKKANLDKAGFFSNTFFSICFKVKKWIYCFAAPSAPYSTNCYWAHKNTGVHTKHGWERNRRACKILGHKTTCFSAPLPLSG